jgi:hypothetical protein
VGLRDLAAALLITAALAPVTSASADAGPALTVDAGAARHAISPYIYGWNFVPADIASQIDVPVDRRGGNAADTLNWQTGVENHSLDYFFENIPTCWTSCPAGWDPARSYTDQIDGDRTAKAKSLIDLPMLGYVPKDDGAANFSQPLPCSFTDANQDSYDVPWDPNCGNGQRNNAFFTTQPRLTTAVAQGPAFQGAWVGDLVNRYGSAANGGVAFYELGNEPALWDSTHHDWHPDPTNAQELLDKMTALAQQVKAHDPTAQVIGPAEWGWPHYFCSALDGGCGPTGPNPVPQNSDWHAVQGDKPLLPWILSQFKAYEDAAGTRLLDYLDIHYYRQDGGADGINATRSLWDPSYTDPSWIADTIRLIPRMHEWVNQNYPGTKLSLSEYDLAVDSGATNDHINLDNLIEADVLGIFGREGLDLATLWPETSDLGHYTGAFKLFRNYDGSKSKFGDTSVSSQSGDQSKLAVYGAERSSDGALTLVVINKTASDLTSAVSLAGFSPAPTAQVFRWTTVAGGVQRVADQSLLSSGFTATFPAQSMSMVVIPKSGTTTTPTTTTTTDTTQQSTPLPSTEQVPAGSGATPVAAKCTVPKLTGLTLKKAKAKLRKAHCRLGKVTRKRSAKRKGRVIAQKPKPRTRGKAGLKVAVVLSRGR